MDWIAVSSGVLIGDEYFARTSSGMAIIGFLAIAGGTIEAAKKMLHDAGYVVEGGKLHYPPGVKETTQVFQ